MAKLADTPRKRIFWFIFGVIVALVALGGRIAWIQFVQGDQLAEKVRYQLQDSLVLQSPRGAIFDRSGRPLAISSMAKSLYVNPDQFKQAGQDAEAVAALLAPHLGLPAAEIKERLTVNGSFIWLKRTLEPEAANAVAALIKEHGLKGFDFVEENRRYYPNDSLAAHVLGFVGTDDRGLEGIEHALDKLIRGESQRQIIETDSYGTPIFKSIFALKPRQPGKSVYLTIDSTIQFIVEQSLDKAMAKTKAKGATVIVMNPRTGEILAMASRPTYNPNQFWRYSANERKNRAISIVYEPGSTFKAVVAAAALQEGLVRPDERFVDQGYIEVAGRRIKNWSGDSYGSVTFTDIIKNSINTGFVQVGMRLGAVRLTEYARHFGFGQATGIELPGEEEGILFNPREMRETDLATMAIGQSIAVTPLQLLTAMAAIANDGVLLKPHIVKEIRDESGMVVSASPTMPVRQVIGPDTARTLTAMLEKVVAEGGGKKATVPGYRFAGKTGTAERLKEGGGGYEAGHYIASFAGFGPVEDPQVVALVVIDDPQGAYYGGEIAAPVFSEIMTQVMRHLNIRPTNDLAMPQPKPANPAIVPGGGADKGEKRPAPPGKVVVPDLRGKSMREVARELSQIGLALTPVGTGVAVGQGTPANTVVDPGTEITVYFEPR
ncbi:Peptidoglycan glycosyltransferase [Thermosinus carboxydivorans Nor1]|uniref:Peptidoglycan glycosyltransferase n=1 Tax=Thermosinus carboxydivorans Nor1 TaxID=401526 RepID=A1HML5_9FIRM|nr:penicillin-binding transpeptidase domain-containing protein [Thermosinus carboxydivorans]EAX48506.1 Peptidoglycan glycosyltransferase [Thermosinus carboxydivorans Nor1]